MIQEIIERLGEIAKSQPSVHAVAEGNIYDLLNSGGEVEKYAAVIFFIDNVVIEDGRCEANLVMYYVDRLTQDRKNRLQIQDTAVETLHNIIASLDSDYDITETYTPFTERFTDVCAGAYVRLALTQDLDDCYETYGG